MKKLIFLMLFIVSILGFDACSPRYVNTVPTYVEPTRPPRPSANYVWKDGDWVWRRRSNTYAPPYSHWAVPNRNRTYIPGHWQSNPRGHRWINGRWQ
jgi:hypothetical protein